MMTRTSVVSTVCIAWTCVSLVYFVSQTYIVMGMSAQAMSTPMVVSLLIIVKNVGETLFEKILSNYILPDHIVKYIHKYPILRRIGVTSVCSCSLFELIRTVTYGALCLASLLAAFVFPYPHGLTGVLASILFRSVLGVVLMAKLPLEALLPRMVSYLKNSSATDSSAYTLLVGAMGCVLKGPWSPADSHFHSSSGTETTAQPDTQGTTSATAQPIRTTTASKNNIPTGSIVLFAVLLTAVAEASVLALALLVPLLTDVLEGSGSGYSFTSGTGTSAGGSYNNPVRVPLMAAARSSFVLYSRPQCMLLVVGAVVQCAVLVFAAGYLSHRRAIALELRSHALAISTYSTPRNSTTATTNTSNTTTNTTTSVYASYSVSAFLLSLLDCDVRLSVSLDSSRNNGCLSAVDAFAAGISTANPNISTNANTNNIPTANGGTASTLITSNGNNNNAGKGGKARLSVVIPPSGNSSGTGTSSARKSSLTNTDKIHSTHKEYASNAPQPHMLLVCVMIVLLVAILQAGATLLSLTDTRCSGSNAVAALASVLLVTFLRDAVPRAALPLPGSQVPPGYYTANTPLSAKH